MLTRRWLQLACVLIGIVAMAGGPRAQDPAAVIYGIGDLTGGAVSSAVRDATRVDGVIYAVGASTAVHAPVATPPATPIPALDTPVLWSSTGGLQALPNLATGFVSSQTVPLSAYAITPLGDYIASQARATDTAGTSWVRVTRGSVPSVAANLNLNSGTGAHAFAALAISDSGNTIYGQESQADGTRTVVRYEIGAGLSHPPLPAGTNWSVPTPRGTSADGLVTIGIASTGSITTSLTFVPPFGYPALAYNTTAFRYVHNAGTLTGITTALPKLTTGASAWSYPLAMSSDGAATVVAGNSDDYPAGEIYLTDGANNVTGRFGSPNTGLAPRPLGGRTDDGAIVVSFSDQFTVTPGQIAGLGLPFFNRLPYVHNGNGWFLLSDVLRAQGLDLEAQGWSPTDMVVAGVRSVDDVDLVFGQGRRRTFDATTGAFTNGVMEGFVIQLTKGILASHASPTNPPADDTLTGAWIGAAAFTNPSSITVYLADGRYVVFTQGPNNYQKGFESGTYSWASNGGDWYLSTRRDLNALFGLQSFGTPLGRTLTVTGDVSRIANTHCTPGSTTPGCAGVDILRMPFAPDSIVGAWTGTIPDGEFAGTVITGLFLGPEQGLRYFVSYEIPGRPAEFELGTYSVDLNAHTMVSTKDGPADGTNDPDEITLSRDGLGVRIVVGDPTAQVPVFNLTRVVPPSTVVPVIAHTPLSASGTVGQPFNYVVEATHTALFTATGLPSGLAIDSGTGAITGAPTVGGQFGVTIGAYNSLGGADVETLTLTIAIPTPVGQNVVVEPEMPEGQGPVTLSFGEITTAGTTTVTVVDQSQVPAPGNVGIGGVVYEVTTTATYQGLITLCFSYAGIDFGTATPRLFHYENNVWVDITTSVDAATQTICGATTTLSPFAVLKSNVVRTGFYAPLNPIAGYLNTVKGGATIPLNFNVSVHGVAQTTTAGLEMTQQLISCDSNAPEDDVEPAAVTGGTSLRYDAAAGHFIQNWKVPKTAGRCYMVRMTTTEDGLALTARFKVR